MYSFQVYSKENLLYVSSGSIYIVANGRIFFLKMSNIRLHPYTLFSLPIYL